MDPSPSALSPQPPTHPAQSNGSRWDGSRKNPGPSKTTIISFRLTQRQADMLQSIDPMLGDSIHDRARYLVVQGLLEWSEKLKAEHTQSPEAR